MNYTIIYHVSSSLEMSEGFVYQSSREWLGKAISRAFQICYLMYLFSTNYPLLVDKVGVGVAAGGSHRLSMCQVVFTKKFHYYYRQVLSQFEIFSFVTN